MTPEVGKQYTLISVPSTWGSYKNPLWLEIIIKCTRVEASKAKFLIVETPPGFKSIWSSTDLSLQSDYYNNLQPQGEPIPPKEDYLDWLEEIANCEGDTI